ncbi:hypothetical protein niasHT_036225 [Heterodera trifolii]|uniref:Uncharacterized protein n=1 Tax=Heterodera trifolii TaxID=157864 RepID=A0ABD2IM76_9BILA
MLAFAFLILFTSSSASSVSAKQLHSFPKVTTIQMSTEEGYRIYEHWTTQAFASVLSVFLQDMHPNKDQLGMVPDQFNECYFGAQTVPRMAKCIVRLLNNEFQIGLKNAKIIDGSENMAKSEKWVGEIQGENESDEESGQQKRAEKGHENSSGEKESVNGPSKTGYYSAMPIFEFAKVRKREAIFARDQRHLNNGFLARKRQNIAISKSHSYNLMEAKRTFGLSPIGGLARFLMSGILEKKNKTRTIPWQETISKIQKAKKAHNQLKREEKKWRDYAHKQMPTKSAAIRTNKKYMTMNSADETTAYGSKVGKLNEQIAKLVNDGIKVGMRLSELQRKSKSIEHSKSDEFNEGKSDEMANYDEDIEGEEYGSEQSEEYGKSGERWANGGEAARAKATEAGRLVEILSPRFMSVTASKSRRKVPNFLHTKGHGIERKMSLPNLMKEGAQLLDRDQNEWLNLIMEASGVNDQVDTVKHLLSSADDGHGTDEEMAKKVEKRYKREFNGLYLTKENVREMYGENEQRKSDIWEKLVENLSKEQLTAMNRSGIVSMNAEQLRLIYGPSSPFNDSQTLRRLLTIVKNGTSVSKMIEADIRRLSEMSSFDLRQNDVILSPAILTPLIMAPHFLHPTILSPLVLTPAILDPTMMSPTVLSPFVLSPQMFSPKLLGGLFLSPYALSPVFKSPLFAYYVILSPSWLS